MKFIKFLLKTIIRITVFGALIVGMFYYISQTPEKQLALVNKLNDHTPFDVFELRANIQQTIRKLLVNSDIDFIKGSMAKLSKVLNQNGGHFRVLDINCGLPEKVAIDQAPQQKVYQWRDENGNIHFGDAIDSGLNHLKAQDLSERYPSKQQYFSVEITQINTTLPLFLGDKIDTGVKKIFKVLSDAIEINRLSKVKLNLKLFGDKNEFDDYAAEKAPGMANAIGFYRASENEAAIWNQSNEQTTLGTIRHESTHVIMASLYGLTPIWLNEGMAEYFTKLSVSGLSANIPKNQFWLSKLRSVNDRQPIQISEELNKLPQKWQSQDVELNYAKAWGLVFFLMSDQQGKAILARYMSRLSKDRCEEVNALSYFEQSYPGGLDQLNTQWRTWLNQKQIRPHRY